MFAFSRAHSIHFYREKRKGGKKGESSALLLDRRDGRARDEGKREDREGGKEKEGRSAHGFE